MATAAPKHDQRKTAIIVGASRGLGLGLAREFARRGWHVTATARNAIIATELADVVAASGGRIEVEEVDIDLAESVDALAARLAGRRFESRLHQRWHRRAGVAGLADVIESSPLLGHRFLDYQGAELP